MATYSFDIVSDYDKAELNNVFDQAQREIINRFDFKNTPAAIDWLNSDKTGLKLIGNSEYQIDALIDIFRKKLAARNQDQKLLDTSAESNTSNLKVTQEVYFKKGLNQDKAKIITKLIQNEFKKVKTSIQGDSVRVSAGSKDDLQAVIKLISTQDLDFPLQFINYR